MTTGTITEDEYRELCRDDGGICLACREYTYGVEPDAEGYYCEACDEYEVVGIEQALIMGELEIEE